MKLLIIATLLISCLTSLEVRAGISKNTSTKAWSQGRHSELLERIDTLEDSIENLKEGLDCLPPDLPSEKFFAEAYSASSQTLRLLYEEAIPLLKTSPDWKVSWWLFWYFGNFIDPDDERWTPTIRKLCLTNQTATATIKHALEERDFLALEEAAQRRVTGTPEEDGEISRVTEWFHSLSRSEAKALVGASDPKS
ncbi:MAG: hypothetical protein AAGJ31_09855 [Verrucomicrobiota bacterium]